MLCRDNPISQGHGKGSIPSQLCFSAALKCWAIDNDLVSMDHDEVIPPPMHVLMLNHLHICLSLMLILPAIHASCFVHYIDLLDA